MVGEALGGGHVAGGGVGQLVAENFFQTGALQEIRAPVPQNESEQVLVAGEMTGLKQ